MDNNQPSFKIQIPEPCSQLWNKMTPETGGRYCTACAKTVADFTHMTDAQILEALRGFNGGCGRFRADQINRDLVTLPAENRFSFASFYKLAASLLIVFSAGKVAAQEEKANVHQTDSFTRKSKKAVSHLIGDTTYVNSPNVLKTEEIEKMAVQDVADQVSTTAGVYSVQKGGGQLTIGGGREENTVYIVDGVLQTGNAPTPKPKKWWQFWETPLT